MSLDQEDEDSSVSSVSTYDSLAQLLPPLMKAGDRINFNWDISHDLQRIEQNSPDGTSLMVKKMPDDQEVTEEGWVRLGQAIGRNTNITKFFINMEYGEIDGPHRSTEIQDAFCAGLAQNRSIQMFHSTGLEYTSGQIQIMSPFFSQNAHLTKIDFSDSALDSEAIDALTEAIKENEGKTPGPFGRFTTNHPWRYQVKSRQWWNWQRLAPI